MPKDFLEELGKKKICVPQKDVRILSISDGDALGALLRFDFDKLIKCPKHRRRNFVKKEGDVAKLIPNVRKTKSLFCYSICSGIRGDGSRFRNRCPYFIKYAFKQVICKLSPSKRVNIKEYARCPKLERIVRVGINKGEIEEFGSSDLANVPKSVCEKCECLVKIEEIENEYDCTFKTGCGNNIIATIFCTSFNCKGCKYTNKGEKNAKV